MPLQGTEPNSEPNSIDRLEVGQATTDAACGQIRTSGFRRLAELEAMLEARARARSSSVLLCMQFSVKVGRRPISSLISSSLLAAVLAATFTFFTPSGAPDAERGHCFGHVLLARTPPRVCLGTLRC